MSDNHLDNKTGAELAHALAGIPATVRNIRLGGNRLFHNRTLQERDDLLTALARVNSNPAGRLDLSGNGESDYQRTILPITSLAATRLNNDVMARILFFVPGTPPGNAARDALERLQDLRGAKESNLP